MDRNKSSISITAWCVIIAQIENIEQSKLSWKFSKIYQGSIFKI